MATESITLDQAALERLIPLCYDTFKRYQDKQEIDIHATVNKAGEALGIADVDKYAKQQFQAALSDGFGRAFGDKDAKAIATIFAASCKPVMTLVHQYATGGEATKLVTGLNDLMLKNTGALQGAFQQGLGVPDEAAEFLAGKFGPYLVSIYAFYGAFKIYHAAAHDAAVAKARRMEIEQLANEAIAQLKAQRSAMEDLLSTYMLDRLLPFSEGVTAMDQAILDNDDDGFIMANAELWQLFGREAQYTNASEFDNLMLSDEAFRL